MSTHVWKEEKLTCASRSFLSLYAGPRNPRTWASRLLQSAGAVPESSLARILMSLWNQCPATCLAVVYGLSERIVMQQSPVRNRKCIGMPELFHAICAAELKPTSLGAVVAVHRNQWMFWRICAASTPAYERPPSVQ